MVHYKVIQNKSIPLTLHLITLRFRMSMYTLCDVEFRGGYWIKNIRQNKPHEKLTPQLYM
jgi:hypothetical protein